MGSAAKRVHVISLMAANSGLAPMLPVPNWRIELQANSIICWQIKFNQQAAFSMNQMILMMLWWTTLTILVPATCHPTPPPSVTSLDDLTITAERGTIDEWSWRCPRLPIHNSKTWQSICVIQGNQSLINHIITFITHSLVDTSVEGMGIETERGSAVAFAVIDSFCQLLSQSLTWSMNLFTPKFLLNTGITNTKNYAQLTPMTLKAFFHFELLDKVHHSFTTDLGAPTD